MAKSIITQTGDLVNYANISAVYTDFTLENDSEGNEFMAYRLYAETVNEVVYVLGDFGSAQEAVAAKNELIAWLKSETFGTFSVTEGAD